MNDTKIYPPNQRLIDLRTAVEDLLMELRQHHTGIACYEAHRVNYIDHLSVTVSYGDIATWQAGGHSISGVLHRLRLQIQDETGGDE